MTQFPTMFWQDFSIADAFGKAAVTDTYNRAFEEWKDDVRYMAELVIVLNHKIWQWYEKNESLARLYNDLWQKTDAFCWKHFKGKDQTYYFRVTD